MKNFFVLLSSVSLLAFTGCAQKSDGVPVYHYGANAGGGSLGVHTTHAGDTPWTIAEAYKVELRDLLDLNRLEAPYKIQTGMRLKIPSPRIYKVHKGDTIYRISRIFDTTTTDLARLNNISAPYKIKEGQLLKIPSRYYIPPETVYQTAANIPVPQPSSHSTMTQSSASSNRIEPVTSEPLASNLPQPSPSQQASAPPVVQKSLYVPKRSGAGFLKPTTGQIISGYGPKADGYHNDGINIKAARGEPVRAAESGVIVYAGNQIAGYGNLILVRHSDGYITAYAHLDKILAKKDDVVTRGQTIGTVGSTGSVESPQLHFEIRKGRDALDPQKYI